MNRCLLAIVVGLTGLLTGPCRGADLLLLAVGTTRPPWHVDPACRGLWLVDVDSAVVVRRFEALGCVGNVVVSGPGEASLLRRPAYYGTVEAGPTLAAVDLGSGAVTAEQPLPTLGTGSSVRWMRAVGDRQVLIAADHYANGVNLTRLLRADHIDEHWQIRAEVDVAEHASLANAGDTLPLGSAAGGLLTIRQLDLRDLSERRVDQLPFAETRQLNAVQVRGEHAYVWYKVGLQTRYAVYDLGTRERLLDGVWPGAAGTDRFGYDAHGRLPTFTYALLPRETANSPPVHIDLFAVDLETLATEPLGSLDTDTFPQGFLPRGDTVLTWAPQSVICFTGLCGPDPPIEYFLSSGSAVTAKQGEPALNGSGSLQFLLTDASLALSLPEVIPTLDAVGRIALALSMLVAVGAVRLGHRSRARTPARGER